MKKRVGETVDWLKHHGKTQADLRVSLQAESTRMPAIIKELKREYSLGGLPRLAIRLCNIEENWSLDNNGTDKEITQSDPFGQLDLLLQEIRDDCEESENHKDTN